MEKGKQDGDPLDTSSAASYLKTAWSDTDLLGNGYAFVNVGTNQVQVSSNTKSALQGVGIDWGSY